MFIRIKNLVNGRLAVEALRISLEVGETRDVELFGNKLTLTKVDDSAELATLVLDSKISLEILDEVVHGYNSGWTSIDQGNTVTFTHNLNVDPTRMLVDVLIRNADEAISQLGVGLDTDDTGTEEGYAVVSMTTTALQVYRGADDGSGDAEFCVRITVIGG